MTAACIKLECGDIKSDRNYIISGAFSLKKEEEKQRNITQIFD